MSFKFDQNYIDFIKKHDDEIANTGFDRFTTALTAYVDWMEGNALCACEFGCNLTSLENIAKLLGIVKALKSGQSQEEVDALALKNPLEFVQELREDLTNKAKARRAPKN